MKRATEHKTPRVLVGAALVLMLSAAVAPVVLAQNEAGGLPGGWLANYTGPRTVGLGGAFVAIADKPIGTLWNPAGLALISQNELQIETTRLYDDTSINTFGFVAPFRRFPSVGFTVLTLNSGEFERTNELNEPLGTFSQSDMAFLFTASKELSPRIALGANFKMVRQNVEDFSDGGYGLDLGVMFGLTNTIRLGASVLNIGGPSLSLREIDEKYPTELRSGVALNFFSGRGTVSGEVDYREGPGATLRAGTEFWVHETVALRVGYFDSNPAGGFSLRVADVWSFDYGMSDHELGVVHRFGLSYQFGGFFASSQAYPSVFSPLGQESVTQFQLVSKTKSESSSWKLDIVDKNGQVVRRFGGAGAPPAHVMWDGKNDVGLTLPDGIYEYKIVVVDSDGRTVVGHEKTVEITTAGPQGAVPVYIE